MGRAPCCDKDNVKRGPWSPEEDATLRDYIERNGTGGNWITLPQKAGLRRCGKSCRLRWLNYLRPNIKHGGFTEEEDNIICALFKAIGSRWSVIASHLQGRTDNDVKNYWNTKLKKKLLKASEPSPSMNQPQLPPFVPSFVKTEDFSDSNNWGFDFVQDPYRFFQELPPLPMQEMNANASCTNPKAEESPAASSFGSSSRDDVFLSEMGFESYSELLNGHGDVASFYSSSSLGVKGEELYQRVTNYS